MVIIKDDAYLVKTRVLVGHYFGGQPEDGFIELHEPTTFELLKIEQASKAGDTTALMERLAELLPKVIGEHSLHRDEATRLSPEEVTRIIVSKMNLFAELTQQYSRDVLFTLGSKSDSK
jgi:hypothetical protein